MRPTLNVLQDELIIWPKQNPGVGAWWRADRDGQPCAERGRRQRPLDRRASSGLQDARTTAAARRAWRRRPILWNTSAWPTACPTSPTWPPPFQHQRRY
jgi:hypothetical protein